MNFLPQYMQRAFARGQVTRLLSACGFAFFILSIVALSLLVPAYLTITGDRNDLEQRITDLKNTSPATELETSLAGHAATLRSYIQTGGVASYQPLNLLKEALAVRPAGISVASWSMARNGSDGSLQLQGIGATRDALLAFRTNVRALPFVKCANYSQQILTVKNDTPFTITLGLK